MYLLPNEKSGTVLLKPASENVSIVVMFGRMVGLSLFILFIPLASSSWLSSSSWSSFQYLVHLNTLCDSKKNGFPISTLHWATHTAAFDER